MPLDRVGIVVDDIRKVIHVVIATESMSEKVGKYLYDRVAAEIIDQQFNEVVITLSIVNYLDNRSIGNLLRIVHLCGCRGTVICINCDRCITELFRCQIASERRSEDTDPHRLNRSTDIVDSRHKPLRIGQTDDNQTPP
jgi:anti-anti-sigma regulatory factor